MTLEKFNRPIIGVGVLVWQQKKLLLGNRICDDGQGCWQFPGGHLEAGETVTECARREVLEETGMDVDSLRHLGYTDSSFVVEHKNYLTLLVSCSHVSGEAKVMEPEKCKSWQWFDAMQLPQPLFDPITLFLHQHSQGDISSPVDLYELHCVSREIRDIR